MEQIYNENKCYMWTVLRKTNGCSTTEELEKSIFSERCAKLVNNRYRCSGGSLTVVTCQPFRSCFWRCVGKLSLLSCGKLA